MSKFEYILLDSNRNYNIGLLVMSRRKNLIIFLFTPPYSANKKILL